MFKIRQCYDSHVHLFGTAQVLAAMNLKDLKEPNDLRMLAVQPDYFRGEWLVGFGWNQNLWFDRKYPDKNILDELYPKHPVSFLRADGHAVWVNSEALRRAGINSSTADLAGGRIERDAEGNPTGVLVDAAKEAIDHLIPTPNISQAQAMAKRALGIFNHAGFTHLRDMTSSLDEFLVLRSLEEKGELTAYIQLNVLCQNLAELEQKLEVLTQIRRESTTHLRADGIKIFYDGALGSEGALLSQCYCGTQKKGFSLWKIDELKVVMEKTWKAGFPVAIHTIGDEAIHQVAVAAESLFSSNNVGELHLEHLEILRPETLEILQKIIPTCHMQPCHWLSDRKWIESKIGSLSRFAFPWAALEKAGLPFYFGSDSPIEKPSIFSTEEALLLSAQNHIPALEGDWHNHHQHPDLKWGAECETEFFDNGTCRTVFDGKLLRHRT